MPSLKIEKGVSSWGGRVVSRIMGRFCGKVTSLRAPFAKGNSAESCARLFAAVPKTIPPRLAKAEVRKKSRRRKSDMATIYEFRNRKGSNFEFLSEFSQIRRFIWNLLQRCAFTAVLSRQVVLFAPWRIIQTSVLPCSVSSHRADRYGRVLHLGGATR